jgi:hypothetical protein
MTIALLFGDARRHLQCCLNGVSFNGFENFGCNHSVRFQSAERDAPPFSVMSRQNRNVLLPAK